MPRLNVPAFKTLLDGILSHRFINRTKRAGLPPGVLLYSGTQQVDRIKVTRINYSADHVDVREVEPHEPTLFDVPSGTVSWIHIEGLHDVELIASIGAVLGLSSMQLEDMLNTDQRPKLEVRDGSQIAILKMWSLDTDNQALHREQISLVHSGKLVVTFQESNRPLLRPLRKRIDAGPRIRLMESSYLYYALLDIIVDSYFIVSEQLIKSYVSMEEAIITELPRDMDLVLHEMKQAITSMQIDARPMRDIVQTLQRHTAAETLQLLHPYYTDLSEHVDHMIDITESLASTAAGLRDFYASRLSNHMNEVMKVLTIIATIFIPLSFLAGVYGMNFEHMPELRLPWGYYAFWAIIVTVSGGMLLYFRKKRWI